MQLTPIQVLEHLCLMSPWFAQYCHQSKDNHTRLYDKIRTQLKVVAFHGYDCKNKEDWDLTFKALKKHPNVLYVSGRLHTCTPGCPGIVYHRHQDSASFVCECAGSGAGEGTPDRPTVGYWSLSKVQPSAPVEIFEVVQDAADVLAAGQAEDQAVEDQVENQVDE